jgi:predicted nucleic acid-binding protein
LICIDTTGLIDLWIAATARCYGARVLTRNAADFERIPGLEVLGYGES